jgi:hypothetical protein
MAAPERDALSSDLEQKAAELEAVLARLEGNKAATPASRTEGGEPNGGLSVDKEEVEQAPPTPGESYSSPESTAPSPEKVREASPRERCKTACRALSSMERSAERICSLVGEGHEKCAWARTQIKDARARVNHAGCVCEPA